MIRPEYEDSDLHDARWAPIAYGHYWDFARHFVVALDGQVYVLDSSFFDEQADDYDDHFVVSRVKTPCALALKAVLINLPQTELDFVKRIPVSAIILDRATRKSFVKLESLRRALDSSSSQK